MLKLQKVAVTGGLACGKSTVCQFLKDLGAYVVSADEVTHQLLNPSTDLGQRIVELLGSDVIVQGHFDRAAIAQRVFTNPTLLRSLEQIMHPAVGAEIARRYEFACQQKGIRLFVAEIPLLFESGMDKEYDATIAVVADPILCQKRTTLSKEEFLRRSQQQWSQEQKAAKATYVIKNDENFKNLNQQVNEIFKSLLAKFGFLGKLDTF